MSVQLAPLPMQRFFDNNNNPLVSGQLWTYAAGTSTPQATYTDSTGGTSNPNPVPLNARGEASVWLTYGQAYKFVLQDSRGNTIWTQDNIGNGVTSLLSVVVPNIATLRTLPKSGAQTAIVQGYYAAGDSGGGIYWLNTNDTSSADNGVTIIVAADGGRWYLKWSGILSVAQAGAKADGTTDNTTFFQNVINVLQAAGGGELFVPASSSGYMIGGTLSITAGGISIVGVNRQGSLITFNNGSADCITFEGASFASQIYGFELRNLRLQFGTKTGGRTVYCSNSNQIVLQNLEINGCWTGIELYQNNTVKIADVVMQGVTSSTGYGIYWHAAGDGSGRSDWLILDNWAVNCMYSGANGLVIDGLVATLIATRCNILQCTVSILVYNSAESANNFPNYLQFTDVQTEGAKLNTVQINGGANFKFVDCALIQASGQTGQGSSDGYVVAIYPDLSYSYTRNITFMGCSIGQGKGSAVFSNARNTRYIGCDFQAGTTMTANSQPALHLGGNSDNTLVLASTNNIYGTPNNWQYGLQLDSGATGTIELGNDWRGSQTKEVQWNSTDSQSYAGADLTSTSLPISSATQTNPQGFTGTPGATLTPAQVLGGIAYIGGTPGSFTNTTPAAAALVAAMASPSLNKTVDLLIINSTNGSMTLSPGSGVTMAGLTSSGSFVIPSGTQKLLKIIFTNTAAGSEAVSIYG
ncbi:hypothetical protein [Paraburkholderia silvatlantica]|uniref:Pectate lyase-like protein n=1 Tax=Paraburkholderia silvatlantica TaxID=321895 RepID=A0ABR6FLT7_9BURK|nr:hypothetical protein [Paraburkholderia silvatlantica]MBB2928399.1 hypothetical protein [Paraburkholderia silvatlantica]PVY34556.1 hypothetical protein C7411_10792 [Paraburkholderia silvatlantica]PXW38771.1 hypothetical protein C7413_10792 [Paraburkholderia silvatlantica]